MKMLMLFLGKTKAKKNAIYALRERFFASPPRFYKKGFTLFELLLVVSLIGLFSSIVMPKFSPQKNRSNSVLLRIQKEIETVKKEAQDKNKTRILHFLPEEESYKVYPSFQLDEQQNLSEITVINEGKIEGLSDISIQIDAPLFWTFPFKEGYALFLQPDGTTPSVDFKNNRQILRYNGTLQPAKWYEEK